MKELDSYQSNNSPKKKRERSKKQKSTYKLFTKDGWPKVMISRDSIVYKKIKDSSGSPSLSFIKESSSGKEEKDSCEHLYCDENGTNFEEEQDVCLISSSSEIQESFELRDILRKIGKSSKSDGSIDQSEFDCLPEESIVSDKYDQQRPIFVDLTTDEKNTWKQTILKQFCDVKTSTVNEMESGNEKCSTGVVLGTRLVISIRLKNLLIDQLFD